MMTPSAPATVAVTRAVRPLPVLTTLPPASLIVITGWVVKAVPAFLVPPAAVVTSSSDGSPN